MKIGKSALSGYMRSGCDRRLALTLATDDERRIKLMPPKQEARPGLAEITKAGREWEDQKIAELISAVGDSVIHTRTAAGHFGDIRLKDRMPEAIEKWSGSRGSWLVQAQFEVTQSFVSALACPTLVPADFAELRPDLIELCPASAVGAEVMPDGTLRERAESDDRIPLRVIDIKFTAQPSAGYFGEVVFYAMALASWIRERGVADKLVVIDDCAVWPGGFSMSAIASAEERSDYAEVRRALAGELEAAPFGVFAPEIRRLFQVDIPRVTSADWATLDFHVESSCSSCPFVGTTWLGKEPHPLHCVNAARESGHLSCVADVTRGGRTTLMRGNVATVSELATASDADSVFDGHQALRSARAVLPARARSIEHNLPATIPPRTGTSAELPRWVDLYLHVTTHFDTSSSITLAIGMESFSTDLAAARKTSADGRAPSRQHVWVNNAKSLETEWSDVVEPFLSAVVELTKWSTSRKPETTMQIFVWDGLERKHLARVISRHLARINANKNFAKVVWQFLPSDEQVQNPNTVHPSPITILSNTVRTRLVAPVPHRYTLLAVANAYCDASVENPETMFRVPELCADPLSDQIPSERAHDIWATPHSGRRSQVMGDIDRTIRARLRALGSVRRRISDDLRSSLTAQAPRLDVKVPSVSKAALTSQLWYLHARVNAALDMQEAADIRAMPAHEREARHHSVRLEGELTGLDASTALSQLFAAPQAVPAGARVFRVRTGSVQAKIKPGDLGFALAPEREAGILESKVASLVASGLSTPATAKPYAQWTPLRQLLEVSIHAFDRQSRLIVLSINDFTAKRLGWSTFVSDAERAGVIDLSGACVVDPVPRDYFASKLEGALHALGNPQVAVDAAPAGLALAVNRQRLPAVTPDPLPGADLMWNAGDLADTPSGRNASTALTAAASLNPSQSAAWQSAMDRRLSIVWGPPGTGKTHTLRAIIRGMALEAQAAGTRLRIGVGAQTYKAVDEVLRALPQDLDKALGSGFGTVSRLRSDLADPPADTEIKDVVCGWQQPSVEALFERLATTGAGVDVVGMTAHQAINLVKHGGPANQHGTTQTPRFDAELFDVLILDEASQLDMAHTALFAVTLAPGFSAVIAGDELQLPPIHSSDPPVGLERWVGSFLAHLREEQQIDASLLETNYRSNQEIVGVAHLAAYPSELAAYSAEMKIRYSPSSSVDWRDELLHPDRPVCLVTYDDAAASSQWNPFEAHVVAELVKHLRHRHKGLADELHFDGTLVSTSPKPMSALDFFKKGVGVVTPHRAQMARVTEKLLEALPDLQLGADDPIDAAVVGASIDTVERFQGQQRDAIIMSYALGDVDAIRNEEEFLLSLPRFNVAASRARAKLIVLVSNEVLHHLASEIDVLRNSDLLKRFAFEYCAQSSPLLLPNGEGGQVHAEFKWYS